MKSTAETVDKYLDELTPERRKAVSAVRDVVLANLPEGYEETMDFGMRRSWSPNPGPASESACLRAWKALSSDRTAAAGQTLVAISFAVVAVLNASFLLVAPRS